MRKAKKKDYVVTVIRKERTPEEDIRIRQEITDVLYRAKMESLQKQAMLAGQNKEK